MHTDGARVRAMTGWDPHNAFPLRGSLGPTSEAPEFGLKFARWHLSDTERAVLEAHGVDDL